MNNISFSIESDGSVTVHDNMSRNCINLGRVSISEVLKTYELQSGESSQDLFSFLNQNQRDFFIVSS